MLNFFRKLLLTLILAPYAFSFLGAASNQAVLVANHGKFPVMMNSVWTAKAEPDANGMIDDEHCIMTSETRLNFLADIFNLHDGIYSIGDFLLMAGEKSKDYCLLMAVGLILYKKE